MKGFETPYLSDTDPGIEEQIGHMSSLQRVVKFRYTGWRFTSLPEMLGLVFLWLSVIAERHLQYCT